MPRGESDGGISPDTSDAVVPVIVNGMDLVELSTLDKLMAAAGECSKAAPWKEHVQRYMSNLAVNSLNLQDEIRGGSYRPRKLSKFKINERGKVRWVEAPPMRDRVVQKVVNRHVLIPTFGPLLIYDCYASLKHRGTSLARKRVEIMLRKVGAGYYMSLDVKGYFNSIDHVILDNMVVPRLEAAGFSDGVISLTRLAGGWSDGIGLNLGSEIPQVLAVYYLHELDNYAKIVKSMKFYGRYMDDAIAFSDSKDELEELFTGCVDILHGLNLKPNERKSHIGNVADGFSFLQTKYSVDDGKIIKRPTGAKLSRERRRLRAYKRLCDADRMTEHEAYTSYIAWRNNVLRDYNRVGRSIGAIDEIALAEFSGHEAPPKMTRSEVVTDTFAEAAPRELEFIL